jgi:hypothetical protein
VSTCIWTLTLQPVMGRRDVETHDRAHVGTRPVACKLTRQSTAEHMSEEAAMQSLTPTPVDPQERSLGAKDEAGLADDGAAAHLSTVRLQPHVKAAELRPGDVVQQCDWSLHVCEVDVIHGAVTLAVTEFGFQLHYAADEHVQLQLDDPLSQVICDERGASK